jgi:hypothetical protein
MIVPSWVYVTPKIEYRGELHSGKPPIDKGTPFLVVGQQGYHKIPCFNMNAE